MTLLFFKRHFCPSFWYKFKMNVARKSKDTSVPPNDTSVFEKTLLSPFFLKLINWQTSKETDYFVFYVKFSLLAKSANLRPLSFCVGSVFFPITFYEIRHLKCSSPYLSVTKCLWHQIFQSPDIPVTRSLSPNVGTPYIFKGVFSREICPGF